MIISRTPLRMSFVGGGSDIPQFYQKNGGAVISAAIDKYIYVTVNQKFDDGIRVSYSVTEEVSRVNQIQHRIVRSALEFLNISGGVEITTIADIPSRGTGLGSSSSFTVGLLHALNAFNGRYVSSDTLGRDSCHIELDVCEEPIGKQDQYAAAFGGFNLIEFYPSEAVVVSPLICAAETLQRIESETLMFYTGITRSASALLQEQSKELASNAKKQQTMREMVRLAYALRDELHKNNIGSFGEILHENWMLKKSMTTGVSNQSIDDWYCMAREAGATGGKILGAGAGGFLMLTAPVERHEAITQALSMLTPTPFRFEPLGSRIIFYH